MSTAPRVTWLESNEEDAASAPRERAAFDRGRLVLDPKGIRRRHSGPGGLTRRELEVLQLVSGGMTNRAVARTLWVTSETVKFHLSNIYRKLGVGNRFEASHWAHAHGVAGAAELEHRAGSPAEPRSLVQR